MTDIARKIARLKELDKELDGLVGRFLSFDEQLRVLSINEEQERLENVLGIEDGAW